MAVRYHVNPETGNPNVCRAKLKCPYGGDSLHYDSKEAARASFELSANYSQLHSFSKEKMSRGARLLLALDRTQQVVARRIQEAENEGTKWGIANEDRRALLDQRDKLRRRLEDELPWDDSDGPTFDDSVKVSLTTLSFSGAEDRDGYLNDAFTPDEKAALMFEQLDKASGEWIKRLSTAEIKSTSTLQQGRN